MEIKSRALKKIIPKFKDKRILVVGDLILDQYIFGDVGRISPEAPVPVVWAKRENYLGGGTANVGMNIIDLDAKVSLCGVIGDDHCGKVLFSLIKNKKIDTSLVVKDKSRPTTLKTRIIAQHQQVVRVDWESVEEISLEVCDAVLRKVKKNIDNFDGVIIEDYGKGMVNPYIVEEIVKLCKKKGKIITVDPKEGHFDYYEGVTALTPNLKEAEYAAGLKVKNSNEIELLGNVVMEKLKPKALLVTLGEDGMRIFQADNNSYHIPTTALEVFDVTGAGDTVIAVFTLALASGASFLNAAVLANFAAGIVVGKLGASTTHPEELLETIDTHVENLTIS
ncbi:MAG: D-glycero-beta-D-manno-heptose-7-phosphate kinase [Candidatus Omnitrophota bacterium]